MTDMLMLAFFDELEKVAAPGFSVGSNGIGRSAMTRSPKQLSVNQSRARTAVRRNSLEAANDFKQKRTLYDDARRNSYETLRQSKPSAPRVASTFR